MTVSQMYTEIVRLSLLATSSYALYLSGTSAQQLTKYKSMSEKAAKVSSTAQSELEQTQKTVGIAVLASVFSLGSLAYTQWLQATSRTGWTNYVALFNTILMCLAYKAVQNYWKSDKAPKKNKTGWTGVGDYADSWRKMEEVQAVLMVTGGLWTLATMMASPNKLFGQ